MEVLSEKKKLNANEKHETLVSLLNTLNQNVNQLQSYCIAQFDHINSKIDKLETKTSVLNTSGPNFTKIDNKEEYLNTNVNQTINMNIDEYLINKCKDHINHQNIYDILNEKYTIYNFIISIIENIINNNNNEKFIFCFPYQKSVIYFWNHEKQTWEKLNQSMLKEIFNVLQKEIISCYNNLIHKLQDENTFHTVSMKFMESGNLIFVDDFDKKCKIFKKQLFEKISIL